MRIAGRVQPLDPFTGRVETLPIEVALGITHVTAGSLAVYGRREAVPRTTSSTAPG
jgi:hypothetical protein